MSENLGNHHINRLGWFSTPIHFIED